MPERTADAVARPRLELAAIVRAHGDAYRRTHRPTTTQHRALRAIATCRTAALGGHRETCDHCGATRITYNSCRNRHCPKCQTLTKERWLAARRADLLPVPYFHVVFTLPHDLNPLAQGGHRAVVTLESQYLNDPSMGDLVDGTFTVVGKVTRVLAQGEGAVSLIRKTALGRLPSSMLNQSFEGFNALSSLQGFALPAIEWEIDAPVVQILPVAIYT